MQCERDALEHERNHANCMDDRHQGVGLDALEIAAVDNRRSDGCQHGYFWNGTWML